MRHRIASLAVLMLCALALAGCSSTPKPAPDGSQPLTGANTLTGKAEVHADVIEAAALRTQKSPERELILLHIGDIKALLVRFAAELDRANVNMRLMDGKINEQATTIALKNQYIEQEAERFWSRKQVRLLASITGITVVGLILWFALSRWNVVAIVSSLVGRKR